MGKPRTHNVRKCSDCGAGIIDVYDRFTGASFPVEETGMDGLMIAPPEEGKRNSTANRETIHRPHLPFCNGKRPPPTGGSVKVPKDVAEEAAH